MARVGIITGSGTYALPDVEVSQAHHFETPFGAAAVSEGAFAGQTVLHVSRHGEGHLRLSNHVNHRANIWALRELGADCVIGCTACGALHPDQVLGGLIVFDELHFLANRLPDGSLCTLFVEPGDARRGHWIIGPPFSASLRKTLVSAAQAADVDVRPSGCYGHVDGPRFNTRTEIAALAGAGVTAVSQTGGPETVLCGEAELPYALMGYATDYANGVRDEPTPVSELVRLMGESTSMFANVLAAGLPMLDEASPQPPGVVYRFAQ
ncbi:MAG: MTAP family purine nucleoside phosphorylase [Actinomycetota bacterium]|nr:MTAP family purine nucleoside phosphorylase [Actinomycetota bacterium]